MSGSGGNEPAIAGAPTVRPAEAAPRDGPAEDAQPAALSAPTRRDFLHAAGPTLLAAGIAPLGAVPASAQVPSDVELLERLIAFERRLESAYEAALRRGAIEPRLGETLRDQERAHADGLEKALSGYGRRAPRATVPPPQLGAALKDRDAFTRFALDVEAEAVRAYVDAAATLRNPGLRQPLGAIVANEAQHEVALRASVGDSLLRV